MAAPAALALASALAVAAPGPDWKSQLSGSGTLYSAHFPSDALAGYACGSAGLVLRTTDGGVTWSSSIEGTADLYSIWFPQGAGTGYAAASDGSILRTTDGGASWVATAVAPAALHGVHFPGSAAVGYAVGAGGRIYGTANSGAGWAAQPSPTAADLHGVHFPESDSTGWAVGDAGTILKLAPEDDLATGSYTGNGLDGRAITGAGFRPDVVIVKGNVAEAAVIRTSTMAGDASKVLASATAVVADRIQSLDADGFTVGADADVNQNGVTYSWVGFRAVAGEVKAGSYAGNGNNNRSIGGVGFQPDYVILFGAGATKGWQKPSTLGGNQSLPFDAAGRQNNRIKALEADGFRVAGDADVNAVGTTYHYVAWRAVAGEMAVGVYSGNGADDRSITGLGFEPRYLLVKADWALGGQHRTPSPGGDSTLRFLASPSAADRIQELLGDGFELGAAAEVNMAGKSFYWAAFAPGGAWTAQNPTAAHLRDVHMADDTTGWVCGDNDTILRTDDGGASWNARPTGAGAGFHVHGIHFPIDTTNGWCVGSGGRIFRTSDGGATWAEQTTPTTQDLRAVWFPGGNVLGWAVGDGRTVLRPASPLMVTGAYTGNGQDGRGLTGVGFAPDLVVVKGDGRNPVARTSTMTGDAARRLDGGSGQDLRPDRIQSLDADGFTLGADDLVNSPGITYWWAAFLARGELQVGSYPGDGGDGRSITGVGFRPDYLVVMSAQDAAAVQRFAGQSGDAALPFSAAGPSADRIQDLESDGFQVGTSSTVNAGGWEYHWVAVREAPGEIDVGSHAGNGFDDRSIAGLGLRPEYVILKAGGAEVGVHRPDSMGGGDGTLEFAATAALANRIQLLEPDGFQVGDHAAVNQPGTAYHWVAFVVDPSQASQPPRLVRWAEVAP